MNREWPDTRDVRDVLADWWWTARHRVLCVVCRLFGHDWSGWEPWESNRRYWEARFCDRCSDFEERNERVVPAPERTVRSFPPRGEEPFNGCA